ncbi:hemin ABC transporter substrate-binding protein [Oceanimonas smirnovii]|uniref:heme/hemin ABC transporter substrate-binding protein n=1 Tax=Oceanimonas smirnovii TaxID=264574 RepID=UPI003AAFF380
MKALLLAPLLLLAGTAAADSERVLSAGSSVTELILALNAKDQLVATDSTSVLPEGLTLPRLGYHRQLSAEGMLSAEPDLVVGSAEMGPDDALALVTRAGVTVEKLPEALTVEALQHNITRLGELLDRQADAGALHQQVQQQAEALKQGANGKSAVFLLLGDGNNIQVAGRNSLADSLITLAGGSNPATDLDGYKPIAIEALVTMQPEVILVSHRHLDQQGTTAELLRRFPLLAQTPAAKQNAIVAINGRALIGGLGLSTLSEAERLHREWFAKP